MDEERPWFCDITGNPFGTDTLALGVTCQCQGCRAARKITSLSERVGELETKLLNSGCPNCNPSKLHAILGDPAKGVSLNARVILSKQEERG